MDRNKVKALAIGAALIVAIAGAPAVVAASEGPADAANCVGQFSRYFAHGGGGTHRSDVAQGFAHGSRPAGLNVYSHVAEGHGSLADCFAMS